MSASETAKENLARTRKHRNGEVAFVSAFLATFCLLAVVAVMLYHHGKPELKPGERVADFAAYALPCMAGLLCGGGLFFRSKELAFYWFSALLLGFGVLSYCLVQLVYNTAVAVLICCCLTAVTSATLWHQIVGTKAGSLWDILHIAVAVFTTAFMVVMAIVVVCNWNGLS